MLAQYTINGFMIGCVYSLIGVGFSLIFGIIHVLNFAYGEFFMIASYLTFFLVASSNIPIVIVFVINFALLFFLGIVTEKVLIKPLRYKTDAAGERSSVIILTFGLQIALQALALLLFTGNYRGVPNNTVSNFSFGNIVISNERLLMAAVSILVLIVTILFITYTKLGRALRSVAQNRQAAQLSGVNINQIYAIAFGLSTALVSIAGTLLSPYYSVYPTVGMTPMAKAFAVTLIGGLGSMGGAIIAGPILGILEALAGAYISALAKDAVAYACVIAILIIYPKGVGQIIESLSKRKRGMQR